MMISFQNVSRTYQMYGGSSITPVRSVDMDINKGEFVLIIGRSGSGKTSLLNLAAGLIRPTAGKIFIKGTDIGGLNDLEISSLRAGTIGMVFQFPSLIPSMNAIENTVLSASFKSGARDTAGERAVALLDMLGLKARLKFLPRQLSAGEQKRVVLARALMNEPEILLADEPTSDLDELTERYIMSVLRELHSRGITILMVTHSTELITYASRVLKMEASKLVELGS